MEELRPFIDIAVIWVVLSFMAAGAYAFIRRGQ